MLGGGLAIAAIGPMEGLLAAAPRMIGAAKLTGREGLALVTGGAGVGAGVQTVGDVATGRRSTAGDIAGAAVGGAIDAAVLPFVGPARAAAVGSSATSVAQDTLNGREVSSERASRAAILGNVAGGVGGIGGRVGSNRLSPKAKGELGEAIGAMRSQIDGLRREVKGKARDYLPGGVYWYPDAVSGDMRFEDKFGVAAKLSKNQEKARAFLGEKFRLYHTVPADIGKVVGGIVGLAPSYHREDRTRSTR